jgi:hypothetical protein
MRDIKQKSNLYHFRGAEMSYSCLVTMWIHVLKQFIIRQRILKKEEGKSQMSGVAHLSPSKILDEGITETETLKYIQFEEVQCSFT